MKLYEKMNKPYDFLRFDLKNEANVDEIRKYQPFKQEISTSLFGDPFWQIQHKNEKITFYFSKHKLKDIYIFYLKMMFIIIAYNERYSLRTTAMLFRQILEYVLFLSQKNEQEHTLFQLGDCIEYRRYIEQYGGSKAYKEKKWAILRLVSGYENFIPEIFRSNQHNYTLAVSFSNQPLKKFSENFEGYEPLSFVNASFLITKSFEFLYFFGDQIVEIYKNNSKEDALRLIESNEVFREYFGNKQLSPITHLLSILQGACFFLIEILCPMRVKEFQGLRIKDFRQGEEFSYFIPLVEKTNRGEYPMAITNQGLIAVKILQNLLSKKDENTYLISDPANTGPAYSHSTINQKIGVFCKFVGAEDIPTTHRLRTTCARYFLAYFGDEGLEFFKNFVGHRNIEMTKHYAKLSREEMGMVQKRNYNILSTRFKFLEQKNKIKPTSTSLVCTENQKKIDLPFCSIYLDENDSFSKDVIFNSFVDSLSNNNKKEFEIATFLQKQNFKTKKEEGKVGGIK